MIKSVERDIKKNIKKGAKSLSTPYKILKILKLLIENPLSINEILKKLEEENIFINTDSLSKYITTLKLSGCNIQKRRNRFYVKYPYFYLNEAELETLAHFEIVCKNLNSKANYAEFQKFLNKLSSLTKDFERYETFLKKQEAENFSIQKTEKYKEKIEIISSFLDNGAQKIKILFENKEFTITPVKFHYFKDSICLLGYDIKNNVNKYFPLDKIIDIKGMLSSLAPVDFGLVTTFKITGRLKNAYAIREGEIVSEYEDYILVSNKKEDKDELFKRLLRYGSFCEILYPKTDREKFKNLLESLMTKFSA